ncbi:MAG: hypothetical protein IIA72_24710 [Proteobacteria bacterium]|nr:hypothetical protein [Pseudomonadota bacterium]
MPKLSANLGMLFAEAPFLERFERAAKAGFTGVEYPSGYDWPAGRNCSTGRAGRCRLLAFGGPGLPSRHA